MTPRTARVLFRLLTCIAVALIAYMFMAMVTADPAPTHTRSAQVIVLGSH